MKQNQKIRVIINDVTVYIRYRDVMDCDWRVRDAIDYLIRIDAKSWLIRYGSITVQIDMV